MQPSNLVGYVLLGIQVVALATGAYAFVHAAIQRPDAFTAAEKLSKPIWLAIIGGTTLLALVIGSPVGSAIVLCAAGIYIVDVRPKVLDVQGKSR